MLASDVVLSPRSQLLSPVSKLHRVRDLEADAQRQRIEAFVQKNRHMMRPSKLSLRTSRKPTFEYAYPLFPKARQPVSIETATPLFRAKKKAQQAEPDLALSSAHTTRARDRAETERQPPRKEPIGTRTEERRKSHQRAVDKAELLRSHQILKHIEEDEKRREQKKPQPQSRTTKAPVLPATNYHLKQMGLASPEINIYAPFTDDTEPSTSVRASPPRSTQSIAEEQTTAATRRPSPPTAQDPDTAAVDLRRRKKRSQSSSVGRLTPMKARLRSHHRSSSPQSPSTPESEPLSWVYLTVALVVCMVVAFVAIYGSDPYDALASRSQYLLLSLHTVAQYCLKNLSPILFVLCVVAALAVIVLYLPQSVQDDDRLVEKLVVCAKEELLLHAKSNLPGNAAVRETYLSEAILDLLGFKGEARRDAKELWPTVRMALAEDSRLRCVRARVKSSTGHSIYLWEWIAPQSTLAMNEYAARVTAHRNEAQ
ncbi:hypothetical protein SDRG_09950 [Saprolegnia diclina VS20]|uniref:Man1/Src1 C-terminal domain-containing protein n=1 Tax=Saprolegnia diclina (strain VS20) TaxID=1156394 RepID=T0RIL5_SAPDV|nr:hypothetical protein SDRG_09950 [Saprolegnia diclina VS20]EQC32198.1 hypothetical protein SDRG_09950 [Saprolegnia diclina VS20]|eukprot:XP_008614139.1 hypothetical protein SDRG_09950 [Saprolegnia diclina VS20]